MTTTGDGVRESLVYPNSRTISFTHDALHRLTGITESGNTIADYAFKGGYPQDRGIGDNSGSRVVNLTFRDQADLDGYDRWGRTTWMRHYKVDGGTDVAKLGYGYSYASNRNYEEDLVNATADEFYTYDTLHRLTNTKRGDLNANKDGITGTPAREQTWVLDALGNWQNSPSSALAIDSNDSGSAGVPSDARTHNTTNEIATIDPEGAAGSFNVIHDDAGNLHILPDRTNPGTTAQRFTHDYRNRLIKIENTTTYNQETPTWNVVVQYFYDGLNRLVKKHLTSGAETIYLYDGWRCIEEREWDTNLEGEQDDAWEARRQYVYGGIYIDEPLIFDKDSEGGDGVCDNARYFYCQQANYNVVAMTDSSGASVQTVTYDPYGQATLSGTATGNPYLFQGQRWDADAGMYYFRNRWYHPVLGRFMQRDPAGYVDGMGLYEFVGGMPTVAVDPFGLAYSTSTYYWYWPKDNWNEAEGSSYTVVAEVFERNGQKCCAEINLWYTFEWRYYQLRLRIEWHHRGAGVRETGAIIAGVGGVMTIVPEPTTSAAGPFVAGSGLALYLVGWIVTGVDSIVSGPLPDPQDKHVSDHWEWRNLEWYHSRYDKKAIFVCTGNQILSIQTNGTRRLLEGKSFPEKTSRSGNAEGTGPKSHRR